MGSQLGDEVKAGTEKLISILDWGYVNPDTGMIRAQCDDSVAEGRYLSLHARVRASSAPRRALYEYDLLAYYLKNMTKLCSTFSHDPS